MGIEQHKYGAVVFDFDGVIGKTMEDNYRAWSKALQHYGVILSQREYYLLEGMNPRAVAETILKRNKMDPANASAIAALKERNYLEDNAFEFYPGALEVLDDIRSSFRLGLVTGAGSERLARTVGKDFLDRFAVVVTGDSVTSPKPRPEPYLQAASKLHLPPKECLAIENAPLGIESAKRAGMNCIALCSTLNPQYLDQADIVVEDIVALVPILKRLRRTGQRCAQ